MGKIIGIVGQVVLSWQVIAITVAVVLYIMLVSYVARGRRGAPVRRVPRAARRAAKKDTGPETPSPDSDEEKILSE